MKRIGQGAEETNQAKDTHEGDGLSGRNVCEPHHTSGLGRVLSGLLVIGVGAVWLARQAGVYFPEWVFTWQMLLVVIGLFMGVKHSFRGWGWLVMIIIGGAFMLEFSLPEINLKPYIWPSLIILVGMFMIFKPKRRRKRKHHYWKEEWKSRQKEKWGKYVDENANISSEDIIDSVSIFGSVKKNVISKNFKGGEITCVFGGADINLSQSDIQGEVVLEINHIFGGSQLVVPANWKVKSEIVAIFGGIEDNRHTHQGDMEADKVLIVKGSIVFGGIDIKSF